MKRKHNSIIARLKAAVFAVRARLAAAQDRIFFLLCTALVTRNAFAEALLTGPLCKGYNSVYDNQFVGLAAMTSFAGIFLKWKFADKSSEAMSGMTKTGMALSAFLSMPEIMGWFNVQPCTGLH